MRRARWVMAAMLLGTVLPPPGSAPVGAQETRPTEAHAILGDVDGKVLGAVSLSLDGDGVRVEVSASGLTEGFHGFHIHTTGLCEPGDPAGPFASAA